jgi:hypothetical protein
VIVALLAKAEQGYGVQLWEQRDRRWSLLQRAHTLQAHGWLQLRLVGHDAQVRLDGALLIHVTLSGTPQAGRVGIRSAQGTLRRFQAESLDAAVADTLRKSA